MIAAGHDCINHSHNHKCGGSASDCTGTLSYGVADFATELDLSTQLIQTNTNVRPLFFVHPYDAYTQTVLDYLKTKLGYLGSRAGISGDINAPNYINYMNTAFYGFDNSLDAIASLKNSVDDAIASGGYLMRELHGIEDQSYGPISRANYIKHLDYVKSKVDAGLLWSATASEVVTYRIQRDAYTIATTYNAATNTINVNFTNIKTLNTAQLRTPITVNVNLGTIAGTFAARQGTTTVATTQKGNIVSFNVYPYQGNIVLKATTTTPQPNNIASLLAAPQSTAIALSWSNPTTNFDEVMIVAKATTAFTTQPNGTIYTANANFTGAGTAFEGGKVVYRGSATSVTVTGLTNGTLYHFKAFSRLGTVWSSGVALSATPTTGVFDATLCYRLTARHSGKVMGLASASANSGIALVQNPWINATEQIWRIKPVDATYYQLISGLSGKVASVKNASKSDLTAVVQSTNQFATNQQWKFDKNTEGYYSFSARHSGKVMDVKGGDVADKTPIIQWSGNGGTNQQWKIESVGCPTGISALAENRIVSFEGHSEGGKNVLNWVVNSENLKDYFEVEKMDATESFRQLAVINGNGTEQTRTFTYTDETTTEGNNIYRLKSIANNGSVEISDLITINHTATDSYTLSPNPASNFVNINLKSYENSPVKLTVFDAWGREIRVLSLENAGKTERIDLEDFMSGFYVLVIQTNGKREVNRKFMVSK